MTNGEKGLKGAARRPSRRAPVDGKRLFLKRAAAGLTQGELAAESGVSTSAISRAERGDGTSPRNLRRLAIALDCQTKDLMPDADVPQEAKSA